MVNAHDIPLVRKALAAALARPKDVTFDYDAPSDTLMVNFLGTSRAATSFLIEDPFDTVYLRVDEDGGETVGLQIEGFANDFVFRHPELASSFEIAVLHGISRDEAVEIAREAERRGPRVAAVTQFLEQLIAD